MAGSSLLLLIDDIAAALDDVAVEYGADGIAALPR